MWKAISNGNLDSVTEDVLKHFTQKDPISLAQFVESFDKLNVPTKRRLGVEGWGTHRDISDSLSSVKFQADEETPSLFYHPANEKPTWFFTQNLQGKGTVSDFTIGAFVN
jgi:hypothetical protein